MTHRKGHVWTAGKLDFLVYYLPAFNTIIRKHFPSSVYVDGYAGPGTNDINGTVRKGSPLVALETVPQFTHLYFVEKKRKHVQSLQEHLAGLNVERAAQIDVRQADFNVEVDSILRALPFAPTFYFLDPEGLELEWQTVQKIGRRRYADVFILISAGGVTRCAGYEPTHDTITRFYGHERWREIATAMDPAHQMGSSKFEAFIDLYLESLRGLGFTHVDRFLIATNSRGSDMHALVFAAKNGTAIKIAGDILKKIQRNRKGNQPTLDF